MQKGLLLLPLFFLATALQSQDTTACDEWLREAGSYYVAGIFSSIPSAVDECLNDRKWAKNNRLTATYLLVETHLRLRDSTTASKYYKKLLQLDPYYPFVVADPSPDFLALYDDYKSWSVSLSAIGGFNRSFVTINEHFMAEGAQVNDEKYRPGIRGNFSASVGFDFFPGDQLEVVVEYSYMPRQYHYEAELTLPNSANHFNLQFQESAFYDNLLLYLRYHFSKVKRNERSFTFYGTIGGGINFLQDARLEEIYLNELNSNDPTNTYEEAESLGLRQLRTTRNRSILAGLGAKYRLTGQTFIVADLRYHLMLKNIVSTEQRSADEDLRPTYGWLDDDKMLHSVAGSIGLLHYLHFNWRKR